MRRLYHLTDLLFGLYSPCVGLFSYEGVRHVANLAASAMDPLYYPGGNRAVLDAQPLALGCRNRRHARLRLHHLVLHPDGCRTTHRRGLLASDRRSPQQRTAHAGRKNLLDQSAHLTVSPGGGSTAPTHLAVNHRSAAPAVTCRGLCFYRSKPLAQCPWLC